MAYTSWLVTNKASISLSFSSPNIKCHHLGAQSINLHLTLIPVSSSCFHIQSAYQIGLNLRVHGNNRISTRGVWCSLPEFLGGTNPCRTHAIFLSLQEQRCRWMEKNKEHSFQSLLAWQCRVSQWSDSSE